ncbi:MAG: hypothetical protein RMK18_00865, partial [Armatimonadota bacterium]|nr:hypothetical protein [Armatimonadota bacterium]
ISKACFSRLRLLDPELDSGSNRICLVAFLQSLKFLVFAAETFGSGQSLRFTLATNKLCSKERKFFSASQ